MVPLVCSTILASPVAPHIKLHGCMLANTTGLPFCNTSLSFAERARDLRTRLTQKEKVCLLDSSSACAVPRLGLPAYNWGVEDLLGAGTGCLNGTNGTKHCPTIFPTLAVLGGSFNESLWKQVGTVIGREVRAANNAGALRARHPAPPGEPDGNRAIGVNGWGPVCLCLLSGVALPLRVHGAILPLREHG